MAIVAFWIEEKEQDEWSLQFGKPVLAAVSFKEDKELFASLGFEEETVWTRYVRMRKNADRHEPTEERV